MVAKRRNVPACHEAFARVEAHCGWLTTATASGPSVRHASSSASSPTSVLTSEVPGSSLMPVMLLHFGMGAKSTRRGSARSKGLAKPRGPGSDGGKVL
eukprot:CAMPEP_0172813768 /NCGR_PEP_ID=MMETSP1075-20121228/10858_1 /TAXON_ID=2916 /ORGANISM="Ceratium fusus, Strain PA161109" /LENGTH=97 /DNA_ID=CAMNT_0013653499 /DNA_START=667 /DNA_END=960 /DNA_ORIENTATION=+